MKRIAYILFFLLLCFSAKAQKQGVMVNPYYDDKLLHFGFSLGVNFMDFSTPEATDTVGIRQSSLLPGFSVGFLTDLRLTRHLSLRLHPALHFSERILSYKAKDGYTLPKGSGKYGDKLTITSIPITIPLYLKWSAEREVNYRPFVMGGGGVSFDVMPVSAQQSPVVPKMFNYFVEVGFGCDLYFSWFKLCPQLSYSIGFNNQLLDPDSNNRSLSGLSVLDKFYSQMLGGLYTHQITLTFNFE